MLASQSLGPRTLKPSVVLAHGFTQNARCWGTFGELCSQNFDVLAVDAPGHGQSGYDNADLTQAGKLILEVGGRAHYVGYSMGGRMLLHAALNDKMGVIRSLILIGATPGIEDAAARAQRAAEDTDRARHILQVGTQTFINEWLSMPMFANVSVEEAGLTKRYENSPDGMAASLQNCGTGAQHPLWEYLPRIQIPVLVIAGSTDAKFTAIGQRMVDAIGSNARFVNIDGGHAVHLENPSVTAAVVSSWGTQLSG